MIATYFYMKTGKRVAFAADGRRARIRGSFPAGEVHPQSTIMRETWLDFRSIMASAKKQPDRTMPDLVLSTPDGVPEQLLDLWDRQLFATVRADRVDTESTSVDSQIRALHRKILADHQKSWFQLCGRGYRLTEHDDYTQSANQVLAEVDNGDSRAIVDPLLCFFAPLWRQQIESPVSIFFFTEPMECAAALQDKWRFPIRFGLALWEYYVINAISRIKKQEHLLFSYTQFCEAPSAYFEDVTTRYHDLKSIPKQSRAAASIVLDSEWHRARAVPDRQKYINQTQMYLYDALDRDRLRDAKEVELSEESRDILFHYGNLRAGYEQMKSARDELQTQLQNGTSAPDNQKVLSDPDVGGSLTEVVVHVRGMEPLELLCEPDNPVIEMLTTTLHTQSQNPNEFVYLQCQGPDMGALYFLAGDLLALETTTSSS